MEKYVTINTNDLDRFTESINALADEYKVVFSNAYWDQSDRFFYALLERTNDGRG